MKKMMKFKVHILLGLIMLFSGLFMQGHKQVRAAGTVETVETAVKVAAVEYYDDNIVVFNNGNTKIKYATDTDAASGNWEIVDADPGRFTVFDISWLVAGDENVIMIKGDLDDTVSRVVIKEKPTKLEVSINYSNIDNLDPDKSIASLMKIITSEGTADNPITDKDLEWRKGDYGQWSSIDKLTVSLLEKYLVKGTYLYFRIRAVDDNINVEVDGTPVDFQQNRIDGIRGGICAYEALEATKAIEYFSNFPDGNEGRRFSSEVKVKILKKSPTMVYGIDGEKFTAAIKYGKEYRVTATDSDGNKGYSGWMKITDKAVKKVSLITMVNSVTPKLQDSNNVDIIYDGTTVAFPQMLIEVRDYATATAASSKITETPLDAQRILKDIIQEGKPDPEVTQTEDDIYVYYFGNSYMLLTIPAASVDVPYEYCIVKSTEVFNLEKASWKAVTKGLGVKILASKAPQDGTLYVRQKEIKSKQATSTANAISYKLASTYQDFDIDYPSVPVVTKGILTFVKGYTTPQKIEITLNESGKDKFEDKVTSVKLGTREIKFTQNPVDASASDTLTLTLDNQDLELMTNCTNRLLTITFENGTVDKSSIKLTIKNPTVSGSLSLTPVAGSASGNTKVTVATTVGTDNIWVYEVGAVAVTGLKVEDTLAVGKGINFTSGMDIAVTAGQYITVYELDADRNIIKYKSIQVTAAMIKL